MDRQRIRRGRQVQYHPTAAEALASGAGPWMAMITDVNVDGTVDLIVDVPNAAAVAAAALASPLITTADADATYGTPEADLINELKADVNIIATLVNELRAAVSLRRNSVPRGAAAGQYSIASGPQAV